MKAEITHEPCTHEGGLVMYDPDTVTPKRQKRVINFGCAACLSFVKTPREVIDDLLAKGLPAEQIAIRAVTHNGEAVTIEKFKALFPTLEFPEGKLLQGEWK